MNKSTQNSNPLFYSINWLRLKNTFNQFFNKPEKVEPPVIPSISQVSVIIPTLNEAKQIAQVVKYALSDPRTGEVIVIDDSSIDATVQLAREAGARVETSSMLGKGASMHDGAMAAKFGILVYLDGDLSGLRPNIISDLVAPIDADEADFVKARFGRSSGRVTELTAKPMIKIFFPELAEFSQPLGGIIAAKKSLLLQLDFESGYGVDIGLLLDSHRMGARLQQVDIGSLQHDSQSLHNLSGMAQEISRVIFERAKVAGRLSVDQIMSVFELEKQNQTDIDHVLTKLEGHNKVVFMDMDGTVTQSRFVVELAKATGHLDKLMTLLNGNELENIDHSDEIASLFRFVHKTQFEQVALMIEIRDGVIEAVNQLRRRGYKVGLISDSYNIAADIIRRRIFADFSIAHTIHFESGVCQGTFSLNRAFRIDNGCPLHDHCKSNVLRYLVANKESSMQAASVVAIGDNINDLCLLNMADASFTIEPKDDSLKTDRIVEISHFNQLIERLTQIENHETPIDDIIC